MEGRSIPPIFGDDIQLSPKKEPVIYSYSPIVNGLRHFTFILKILFFRYIDIYDF